ncbi:MAG: bifunctional oligoribonuclease/PAP phosphatase NrnA [Gemmatimonadota bacterium]|jgi:phosphoesterase RecJ-like protein|nr:bifunctional oligoribonuclease/PAP phosphatase NrnA [Gemmatimonadota bacterium]MDP6801819.1 bifunctional oligoribonuclease/PAP phosphatase NrnA [Gemmatimonadota bacterium]MDP7031545.1 bifunctional oligoribonuclease/PAP phosphatase NrnA [Gemmatimonadota bacterium]
MTRKVLEFVQEYDGFRILAHRDPDGDSLGSQLGLANILRATNKSCEVLVHGPLPASYDFLPGVDQVLESPAGRMPDGHAVIVLDSTSPERLGPLQSAVEEGVPLLNIDHHPDNTRFGNVAWVDPTAAATAQLIAELASAASLPVSPGAAFCLYTGLLTDTGRFTFSNTDARALEVAAGLVRHGADPRGIATQIYERLPAAGVRLLGKALDSLEVTGDGRVGVLLVTRKMLAETGASTQDSEGFATFARSIRGVRVGLFLRETVEGDVKVSFRSNEGVQIDGLAGRFGGGGHAAAAGARIPGPIEEAKEVLLQAIKAHLDGADS